MVDVLVRAADAGDTYIAWRWLDDLDNPRAQRLDTPALQAAVEHLDRSLIAPLDGETSEQARRRAMTDGSFRTLELERALSSRLARAAMPERLRTEIIDRRRAGEPVRVRMTPSPRLARIPWETLVMDEVEDRRLLDLTDVVYDPPSTVRAERSVTPAPWESRADLPGIFLIDPDTGTAQLESILVGDDDASGLFRARLDDHLERGLADPNNAKWAISRRVSRTLLSKWLLPDRSRFFYYGHVSAEPEEPGSASLHLSDEAATTWGMATPMGPHLPLSALDLLLGSTTAPPEQRAKFGADLGLPGHLIWPMPPRVAVIACEGGADFRSTETFGLVIAMLNAGAELVTTTRWTMPTDKTFWDYHDDAARERVRPTTELALQVDAAHGNSAPIEELARWQRGQLALWRQYGRIAQSPLVWASLINTWAPAGAADAA